MPESERAPDIRVMYYDEVDGENRQNVLDVEVVTLEKHSSGEDIAQFILNHKLNNPKKAYSPDVAIICYLNRRLTAVWKEVSNKLVEAGKPNSVYAVGKVKGNSDSYQIVQLNPSIDLFIELEPDSKIPKQDDILRGYRTGTRHIKPILKHNPFDLI